MQGFNLRLLYFSIGFRSCLLLSLACAHRPRRYQGQRIRAPGTQRTQRTQRRTDFVPMFLSVFNSYIIMVSGLRIFNSWIFIFIFVAFPAILLFGPLDPLDPFPWQTKRRFGTQRFRLALPISDDPWYCWMLQAVSDYPPSCHLKPDVGDDTKSSKYPGWVKKNVTSCDV